ncbi:hypothetical protein VTH82DRAFT_3414 [Thermothelomyces myriococcoides]
MRGWKAFATREETICKLQANYDFVATNGARPSVGLRFDIARQSPQLNDHENDNTSEPPSVDVDSTPAGKSMRRNMGNGAEIV